MGNTRILVVGLGGLGSPVARVLARSGVAHLTLVDDDRVDLSNLQRQTLYQEADAGQLKVEIAAEVLRAEAKRAGHRLTVHAHAARMLPSTALGLISGHDLVVEGGDNFATKFMAADACSLARVPLVQAGVIRWSGWALGYHPNRGPCLRCIFEDIPQGHLETCSIAGVAGPVVGVLGALQAGVALRLVAGDLSAAGDFIRYDGLHGALRRSRPQRRAECPLCRGTLTSLDMARYMPPECAA